MKLLKLITALCHSLYLNASIAAAHKYHFMAIILDNFDGAEFY